MTNEQKEAIRQYLSQLSVDELYDLKKDVDEQIEDLYFCDENFFRRTQTDSYIYAVVYEDCSYHYYYLGERAYNEYMGNRYAKRVEYKTKDLFPTYGVLMSRGEL